MSDVPIFPQPLPTDPEDVAWALSTAQAMWTRGERADALRWVKRASESAEEAGDDDRAFALARQAAELKAFVNSASVAPPPPVPASPPPVPASPPPAPEPPLRPSVVPASGRTSSPRPVSTTPQPPTASAGATGGFRPRAPGAPAPAEQHPPSVRPAARTITTPRPQPTPINVSAGRASQTPPPRASVPQIEPSVTEVHPFVAPVQGGDPDDWPTHAFSEEDLEPPRPINEAQQTIATSFHPSSPGPFYSPTAASTAKPAPSPPVPSPPVPSPPVSSGPASSHQASVHLITRNVWIFHTNQGTKILPVTSPRPEGAIEAVVVATAAELNSLF